MWRSADSTGNLVNDNWGDVIMSAHKFSGLLAASLAAFVLSASAVGAQDWQEFKKIGNWTINQYASSEAAGQAPSCSAVIFSDHINAFRVERFAGGHLFGLNGLDRKNQGPTYNLGFWFDEDKDSTLAADAGYVRDAAYEMSDWLSHFQGVDAQPDIMGLISAKKTISLVFEMPGNRTGNDSVVSTFSLKGSAAALRALEECFQHASNPPAPNLPASPNAPTSDDMASPDAKGLEGAQAVDVQSDCPSDGPRLPGSGLCRGRAVNYLSHLNEKRDLMEGCEWIVNETPLPGGDYLLYLATKCEGNITTLELSAGAHAASLIMLNADGSPGWEVARVFHADADTPEENVMQRASSGIPDPEELKKCMVRAFKPGSGYPANTFQVDYKPEYQSELLTDEPNQVCGEFGRTDDSAEFWRVFGGYAMHFDMGQDAWWGFDPFTLTVLTAAELER